MDFHGWSHLQLKNNPPPDGAGQREGVEMDVVAKHTPGPWVVEDRRHAALKNIRVVRGGHEVCQVFDVHQRDYLGGFKGDNKSADAVDAVGLANAQLIAAAPDLLDALREIATHGDDDNPCGHESITWCRKHIEQTASDAIAKATKS